MTHEYANCVPVDICIYPVREVLHTMYLDLDLDLEKLQKGRL